MPCYKESHRKFLFSVSVGLGVEEAMSFLSYFFYKDPSYNSSKNQGPNVKIIIIIIRKMPS